jgi:DNA-binding transcriptional MerR regulator
MEADVPDKLFYKIGEVERLTSLRPSILRYWETEFCILQPHKSRSGQRLYTRKELDLVLDIKRLLYSEKLTIEGARRLMAKRGKMRELQETSTDHASVYLTQVLRQVKDDLKNIRDSL